MPKELQKRSLLALDRMGILFLSMAVFSTLIDLRSEDWFNTGLDSDGWNPPFLDFTSLYHINRPQFYSGVGAACAQYDSYFQSAGDSHGIDPTILAFIAMQESSCNADAGGPTPGLMQVSVLRHQKLIEINVDLE